MIVPRFIRVRADKAGRRFFRFIHDLYFSRFDSHRIQQLALEKPGRTPRLSIQVWET